MVAVALAAVVLHGVRNCSDPALGQTAAQSASQPNDSRRQLERVEKELSDSKERQRKLQTDLEGVRADRARLESALLSTAAKTRGYEAQALDLERKLAAARSSEEAIKKSLLKRRLLIAKVLAILQRMGRDPPPAVLVDPGDILTAIRTSMLLGSLLPEMRAEVESLVADLSDLTRARESVAAEQRELSAAMKNLAEERARLSGQLADRQTVQDTMQKELSADTARAQELARKAASLKDLIASMGVAAGQAKPPEGIAPAVPFFQRRGSLEVPVEGVLIKGYGERDMFGAPEPGEAFATLPGAVVTSPAAGWVAYSGTYRSYGKLLILNAGDGYYVVMAGMDRINVEVGQYVVAGEPIAQMGDGSVKTAAAIAIGSQKPVFYVEFRKDGATIDPGPWWAKSGGEKVRG